MRLIFMGTPDFSCAALDALHRAGHQIAAVYTQPPRPAGRGKKLRQSAVHERTLALGLPVHTPLDFKDADSLSRLRAHNADIAVVVAYGLLLPPAVLDTPRLGCVNIHASLLPRWRGAAPIQRAIMAGDMKTGVCIMQMDAGLDTGTILLRQDMPITPIDTAATLHDRLACCGADLIVKTLAQIETLPPIAQEQSGITYAHKITKAEARIDWTQPASAVDAHIRGLSPFPGAWFDYAGERIKVLRTELAQGAGATGTVLDDRLLIACGDGAVRLLELQRAGRGGMPAQDFLRGFALPVGTKL